ncbi:MAG: phytanoyl-CoA dioxygenase family protein, partial [Planctomycetota bacterium]
MSLENDGYEILRGFYNVDHDLDPILAEIDQVGSSFDPNFGHDLPHRLSAEQQSKLYSALRYFPSLIQLASNRKNLELAGLYGLEAPAIMHCFNVRMDAPAKDAFNFHWHQDLTYLLGSLNSLTYWIPLTTVNRERGTIEIVPSSHRGGVLPVRYTGEGQPTARQVMSPKDLVLENEPGPETDTLFIEAEPGDLVVFKQLLLHRST